VGYLHVLGNIEAVVADTLRFVQVCAMVWRNDDRMAAIRPCPACNGRELIESRHGATDRDT
jgi:hypothetical protein